jgi:hypothetical protein
MIANRHSRNMTVDGDTAKARLAFNNFISPSLQNGVHQIDISRTNYAISCLLKIGHSKE